MHGLILSLFPGVDLLGRAFHAAGWCVVLGPDLLLDTRIEDFHAPAGHFTGVIGGPPCTNYSDANRTRDTEEGDRLVRHYLRVVAEAAPLWWLMENVRNVPDVGLPGYTVQRLDVLDTDFGGRQSRLRHIQFGHRSGWIIRPERTPSPRSVTPVPTLTTAPAGPGDRHGRRCAKQGFATLPLRTFTPTARRRAIGNGVPFGIGFALARAVTVAGPVTPSDCRCGCGRRVTGAAILATPACRQRHSRRRRVTPRLVTLEKPIDNPAPSSVTSACPGEVPPILSQGRSWSASKDDEPDLGGSAQPSPLALAGTLFQASNFASQMGDRGNPR